MSDVEALADEIGFGTANAGRVLRSSWLAAHVQAARAEALEEAADEIERTPVNSSAWRGAYRNSAARLRARAAALRADDAGGEGL